MDRRGDRSVDDADGGQRKVMTFSPRLRLKPATTTAFAFALLSAAIVAGCSSPQKTESSPTTNASAPKAPDGRELRSITLPDLLQMAPSAQKQIRDQYASLTRTIGAHATVTELSNAYGDMGKLLMAAQYSDPAEACLLNAQSLDPSEFRWPYYLAHLYRTRGDVVKSRSLFERAIQLRPGDVSTLVWLGNAYLDQGLPDEADAQFSKALSLDGRSISARYGLGRAALAKNDYRRAVTNLEDVLKMDPKAVSAHYPLSLAYNGLGDSRKADELLR